jgi:hypothetical protein
MVKVWRYQRSNQNLYIEEEDKTISNFGHCIVCSSSIYRFWLPFWYLQALTIVLSVRLRYMDSDYPFGIFKLWRYQRDNQNSYIEEEQTTQWPKEKYKRTNNDLQNIHIKLLLLERWHSDMTFYSRGGTVTWPFTLEATQWHDRLL